MLVWGGICDTNRGRYYYLYLLEVETEELKANSQHRALHDKNCILLRRKELSVCIKEYWIILVVLSQLNIKLQIIISALQGLDTLRTLLWHNLVMWSTWCCSRHQTEGWFNTITRITREALLYTVYPPYHIDCLVVGAGISGLDAAYHLQTHARYPIVITWVSVTRLSSYS